MKKALLLALALVPGYAAMVTAEPVTLYRIDLNPGCDAYRFAADHALPVFYAGRAVLLAGQPVDAARFPQVAGVTLAFAGDSKELRWVHARRGATLADLGAPAVFSDGAVVAVQAPPGGKGIDPARFLLSGFTARPFALAPQIAAASSGLTADTAIARIAQQVTVANFQATDSALQAFNTRSTGAPNHPQVAEWIRGQFLSFGIADVKIDSYLDPGFISYLHSQGVTGSPLIRNVIATIPGLADTHTIYVVGGHYDTSVWPYNPWAPGADDNGSGATATLEMARVMAANPPNCTVTFVAFDCEEWGLYGSRKFAQDAAASGMNIGCMMNYDMIANTGNDSIFNSEVYPGSEQYAQLFADMAGLYGRTNDTTLVAVYSTGDLSGSDSWSFYQNGFQQSYAEEYVFSGHWHQTNDSTTYMNMRYGTSIVRAGIGLLATLANYPQPVAGLQANDLGDGGSLLATWQPAAAGNITGYKVYWGRTGGSYRDSQAVALCRDTISGLAADSSYSVAVLAIDDHGRRSPILSEVTGTPRLAPLAPQNLTATPLPGGVRVDWKKNAELDLAGYVLYRRIGSGTSDSLTVLTDSTYLDQPLAGASKYYYAVRAYDNSGNRSTPSAEVYGRPVTLDQGILVIDETYNWTSGSYPRDTTQDNFYHSIMNGYRMTDYEFDSAGHKPVLADLAPYSTVLWHGDDYTNLMAWMDTTALEKYLDYGGKLWFEGWKPLADLRNNSAYPASFTAGSFVHDYLKIGWASLSSTTSDSVIEASGLLGYPDLAVDSAKVPIAGWRGTMRAIEWLTPLAPAEGISAIGLRNSGSSFEGQTCGLRYLGSDYKLVYLGYPLYFMRQDQARALAVRVMSDFGEAPLGLADGSGGAFLPSAMLLEPCRPNPFREGTEIRYQLPAAGPIELAIFNIAGQQVRMLASGAMPAGRHSVKWDGRDGSNRPLSAGIYIMRLKAHGQSQTRKLALVR